MAHPPEGSPQADSHIDLQSGAAEWVESELAEIARLCNPVPQAAEDRTRALLTALSPANLKAWEDTLRESIEGFFLPKRRRRLISLLEERLTASQPTPATVMARSVSPQTGPESGSAALADVNLTPLDVDARVAEFEDVLRNLSEFHIFQWSTFYRDWLAEDFDWFLGAMERYRRYPELLERIHRALAAHSQEVFQKGYRYQISQRESEQYALSKSFKGLQRFLDLPIEFYSARLPSAADLQQARRLRALTSCMLSAVLDGYAQVNFGSQSGGGALSQHPVSWAHTLAFLVPDDLDALLSKLEPNDFVHGVTFNLMPLVEAIELLGDGREHVPLPAVCQLRWDAGRLAVWLRPSTRSPYSQLIELECYLGARYVQHADLAEAAGRGAAVIVAPLGPELRNLVQHDQRLRAIVVAAEDDLGKVPNTRESVRGLLVTRAYRQGTAAVRRQPLQQNVARAFPLDNPDLLRHFLVYRQTVRDLLRSFESRSGVRLWCSVRRSGKTTAGARLDTTTGQVTVVKQTCDTTGESTNDSVFYDHVLKALADGNQLPSTFFADLVQRCGDGQEAGSRVVFVLDEYETLFGRLAASLRRDTDMRYVIIQPLLNQMVAFARANLIIFLGQQPNAHFILMDQNQLSPYVRQDAFPLFGHNTGEPREEFAQLVRKVLTAPIDPDVSFINAVFKETAGHPFLTVNLLADFVDWLIEQRRPVSGLALTSDDVEQFILTRLGRRHVGMCRDYTFFREAAGQAMSESGKIGTPWLHAVYSSMSQLVRSAPETLRCTRGDFSQIASRIQGTVDPDRLLLTASDSNFLAYDDQHVWPKIRLLGRIAGVSQGVVQG